MQMYLFWRNFRSPDGWDYWTPLDKEADIIRLMWIDYVMHM